MPSSEKDKLIFRMLKSNPDLVRRLSFELVSGDSVESRRKQTQQKLERNIVQIKQYTHYMSPGILMMNMRDTSGIVNDHVKITKDKYGEVSLQIYILKEFLQILKNSFTNYPANRFYTINIYIVARIFKIMVLLKKMHEDYMADFVDDLEIIGQLFNDNPCLIKTAVQNGLNVNWLTKNEIPDDIAKIEKDLRQRGYLKH